MSMFWDSLSAQMKGTALWEKKVRSLLLYRRINKGCG